MTEISKFDYKIRNQVFQVVYHLFFYIAEYRGAGSVYQYLG